MSLDHYLTIQQIIMGSIMALGCQLIFGNIPTELKGSRIHRSSQVMGLAFAVIPLASFIYFFLNMKSLDAYYATAINLTAYSITSTFIALSYFILLNKIKSRLFHRVHILAGLLFPIPMWFTILFCSECVIEHTIIASYTIFGILVIYHAWTCIYFFREEMSKVDKSHKNSLKNIELTLVRKTIYIAVVLIVVSLCAPSFFSYSLWLGGVFVCSYVGCSIYIYMTYHKILACNINALIKTPKANDTTISDDNIEMSESELSIIALNNDIKLSIEKQLQIWIEQKEFLQPDISINQVSKSIMSNRTYLSKYINSEFKCSFRTWITSLRIDEAKKLLISNPELAINDIASRTGFASTESFSHIFTRIELQSPSRWREENITINNQKK